MASFTFFTPVRARSRVPFGRLRDGAAFWTALAALLLVLSGLLIAASPRGVGAATSGWTIATVPGTGNDDILLGTACPSANQCFAAGISLADIAGPTSIPSPIVDTWNGTSWSLGGGALLPAGFNGGLFDVACASTQACWAVGAELGPNNNGNPTGTLAEQWDGSAWSVTPTPVLTGPGVVGGFLQSVTCVSLTDCIAVGYTTDVNGQNLSALIEQWNGADWTLVPGADTGQAFDALTGVNCVNSADCWAVGNAGPAQQDPNFLPIFPGAVGDQGLIEHWNGSSWSVVASTAEPAPGGGYLNGIECVSSTACWASGAVTDSSGQGSGILMESWNGSAWIDVSSSVPAPSNSVGAILSSISCLQPSACWAVGSSGTFGGGGGGGFQPQTFVENWNGSSWSIEPSPDVSPINLLNSVACVAGVGCTAVGTTATEPNQNDPGLRSLVEQMSFPPASSQGYLVAARDGGVFAYGTASFDGSMGGQHLNAPIVGAASTPDGKGYWLVASDGGVFSFGDASFYGSMGGKPLNRPIVGVADTSNGKGYWLVASDGGVFAFGDAAFAGSMGGIRLNAPVVGMASSGVGGYWLVASDGGIFSFNSGFYGSAGSLHLHAPVTGMAPSVDGRGYSFVAADGGVFTYGDAAYFGSVPGQGIVGQPSIVGIAETPTGAGYWLTATNGALYAYGDAQFLGAPAPTRLVAPIAAITASP